MTRRDPRSSRVRQCGIPSGRQLPALMAQPDYQDAFQIASPIAEQSIVETYVAIFGHMPAAFKSLIYLRNALVAPFGVAGPSRQDLSEPIDTKKHYAVGEQIGRWNIVGISDDEIVTGLDDVHLNFRVSVKRILEQGVSCVTLTTAVVTHNVLGRAYLATILPFHRFGVARLLSNAARAGRL